MERTFVDFVVLLLLQKPWRSGEKILVFRNVQSIQSQKFSHTILFSIHKSTKLSSFETLLMYLTTNIDTGYITNNIKL